VEVAAGWTATPGVHILYVPATPVIDLDELDEADLDAIAAGDTNNVVNNQGLCLKIGKESHRHGNGLRLPGAQPARAGGQGTAARLPGAAADTAR
jgi:hypothetical protein